MDVAKDLATQQIKLALGTSRSCGKSTPGNRATLTTQTRQNRAEKEGQHLHREARALGTHAALLQLQPLLGVQVASDQQLLHRVGAPAPVAALHVKSNLRGALRPPEGGHLALEVPC